MFFRFPPDARWSPERAVVEFGIGVGEYEGVVRVSRRVFQILLSEALTRGGGRDHNPRRGQGRPVADPLGDDAHRLDDLVRRSPEQAYDVDFFARPVGITARGAGGER